MRPKVRHAGVVSLFAGLCAACSSAPAADVGSARLDAFTPAHAPLGTFLREGDRLASPGYRAAATRKEIHLGATLPAAADGVVEIGLGRSAAQRLAIRHEGAASTVAEIDGTRTRYAQAFPHTDLVWIATDDRVEELLVLADAGAPSLFAWSVAVPPGVSGVDQTRAGVLEFRDVHGDPAIRVLPPYAVDARGTRRAAEMRWSAGRLEVRLDRRGLSYPIVLDPAWETADWVEQKPATSPPARQQLAMAYDPDRQRTVIYGGLGGGALLDDTWEWDGQDWTLALAHAPAGLGARHGHAMAYAGTGYGIVLFGGAKGATLENDTWAWNGAAWTQLSTAGNAPSPRIEHAMAAMSPSGGLYLAGGYDSAVLGDSWNWVAGAWYPISPQSLLSQYPVRALAATAWGGNTALLFGGYGKTSPSDDLWMFLGFDWQPYFPNSAPSGGRYRHAMVQDTGRGRAVTFGGNSIYGLVADTWEYDGTNFSQISDGNDAAIQAGVNPAKREYHAMAYDEARRRTVLFGGVANGVELGDTWEFHRHGGMCNAGSQCETGACVDYVCCESTACGTCESCDGSSGVPGTCSPVRNGDDPDSCTGTKTCDPYGVCKKKNGQPCSQSPECVGGHCTDGLCCDAKCDGECEACDVQGSEGACSAVSGPPHGSRAPCAGDAVCAGVCDGVDHTACKPAAKTTTCGTPSCAAGTETKSACDGNGACVEAAPRPCSAYACGATACKQSCATDVDCAAAFTCAAAKCVPRVAHCDGDHLSSTPDGKTIDCSPYRCDATGACRGSCASIDDCVAPAICDPTGHCGLPDAAPADSGQGSGCQVAAPGTRGAPLAAGIGLALALAGLSLRRREARRS